VLEEAELLDDPPPEGPVPPDPPPPHAARRIRPRPSPAIMMFFPVDILFPVAFEISLKTLPARPMKFYDGRIMSF
jgi:hypothetical protein